jgi:Mn2+/Fe2+ NRAMP family transporter
MNDPISGLAVMAVFVVAVGAVVGFYADHQRQKYHALAEAEREAERHAGGS